MKASLRRLILVGSLCTLCILMVWLIGRELSPGASFDFKHPGKFDRGEWILLGESERLLSERQSVLDDLVENDLRLGMSSFEVDQVLGPADSTSGANAEVWHYNINGDYPTPDGMSEDNFELRFDSNWRVISMGAVIQ